MTLDEVDLQVLLLDRIAAARRAAKARPSAEDTVDDAIAEAMGAS